MHTWAGGSRRSLCWACTGRRGGMVGARRRSPPACMLGTGKRDAGRRRLTGRGRPRSCALDWCIRVSGRRLVCWSQARAGGVAREGGQGLDACDAFLLRVRGASPLHTRGALLALFPWCLRPSPLLGARACLLWSTPTLMHQSSLPKLCVQNSCSCLLALPGERQRACQSGRERQRQQ